MIESRAHVWRMSLAITISVVAFVAFFDWLIYPPDELAKELVIGMTMTSILAFPISFYMGLQILRSHDLTRELQRLVYRDKLTDVATRDFFFKRMEAVPDDYGVSLVVDIDHFKLINDSYGHLVGDRILRNVAAALCLHCRDDDVVCRFGGEEFVVFLCEAEPELGERIAERMRRAIEKRVTAVGKEHVRVTVSIGGSLKSRECDINRSIHEADLALYRAKKEGRNRTVMSWLLPAGTFAERR